MAAAASPQSPSLDFGFAFNDINFSDRIMQIVILPDSEPGMDHNHARNRKRRRECDDDPLSHVNDLAEQSEEQISKLNSSMPYDENREEVVLMIKKNQPSETDSSYPASAYGI